MTDLHSSDKDSGEIYDSFDDAQWKNRLEDGGAIFLEIAASLVPLFGNVASILVSRSLITSSERRTERILGQLRDDLVELARAMGPSGGRPAVDEDVMHASVLTTVRQLLESDSDEKRSLLRNALLNRAMGFEAASDFQDALERVQPGDMNILRELSENPEIEGLTYGPEGSVALRATTTHISARVARLESLGLMDSTPPFAETFDDALQGVSAGEPRDRGSRHAITTFGLEFLNYVSDPHPSAP
jgi:hypothetical protein